ncbi:hypothetical protein WJX81_008547 [Elliptochloris bilobata]|uniref:Uncharacterized protein n=1 Tax=Elliptochloris bilobata TaxID=381761 RepID=A0AAW1QYE0_9CHLO
METHMLNRHPACAASCQPPCFSGRPLPAPAPASSCSAPHPLLAAMRGECTAALRTQRMPTMRNEEYRFTDITPILQTVPRLAEGAPADVEAEARQHPLEGACARVVVVDGAVDPALCNLGSLPDGVYLGPLAGAPAELVSAHLGRQARERGSPFALLNGAVAHDVACLLLPEGVELKAHVHVLYLSTGAAGAASTSAPRLLVVLGAGASATLVEEFAGAGDAGAYFCNAVAEIVLGEDACLVHGYVQLEARAALHMKATLVAQAARSSYRQLEARLGGRLSRQDLGVEQGGEATDTVLRSFLLAGEAQLHDLHSKLHLQHPAGTAAQLHKCIVAAASGRGVFDGNVRVERLAQKTDAAQLSRNLLLVPRATVNVKPNLQIVADDVKCTHGAAISDLEESQLFYLQARGVDNATARRVLVYSFGAEVTAELPGADLRARIQAAVNQTLAAVVPLTDEALAAS